MRVYITSRYKITSERGRGQIEAERLCLAVRDAEMEDFHFNRDIEHYQSNLLKNPKELWFESRKYISELDALLIDISDNPSGGRLVEVGIAYALNKPIYVVVKKGVGYKSFYDGIATAIIKYDNVGDITEKLRTFQNSSTISAK